jgi:hypothetical protein
LVAAAYEGLVMPQVMTAVEDLVSREASGVLEVTGSPSGAIYLDGGRIAFARASWVPGLAVRLRTLCPALAGLGDLSSARDANDAAIAEFAVRGGYVTVGALHELIRSIVVDVFLVLAIPLAMDSPAAAIRFTSTRTYWTEMFPRLGAHLVRGEAFRVAECMAEQGLAPTTAVALCGLRAPVAVLTREQWAVACQIGDCASALDLAARRGAALSDTLECLGGLARAGLCAPVRVGGQPSSRGVGPVTPADPPTEPPVRRLPVRYPVQDRAERPGGIGQPPTVDVLRQVLNGLRKLS